MRIIIDTNVFISGLLGSGSSRRVYLSFKEEQFDLVSSEILFEELKFVLERPKFRLLIAAEERRDLILLLKSRTIFVRPREKVNICRDLKDNKVLECALEARPDFIVSQDSDLLMLKSFRGIPIIKPRELLKHL